MNRPPEKGAAPQDRSLPPLHRLALAAALLLPLGLRHQYFWGGRFGPVLNILESLLLGLLFLFMAHALLRALADPPPWNRRGACLLALIGAAFLALPPFLSDDVRDYLMRGRMLTVLGANPYLHTASEFPADPYVVAGLPAWADMRCPYGPLTTEIQGLLALAAEPIRAALGTRASILCGILLFKVLAWACLLGTALAVAFTHRGAPPGRATAAGLALAASPFLLLELAGMAHNDGLMILPATWAVALALRHRFAAAGVLLVLAASLKPPAVLLWPLLVGPARRQACLGPLLAGSATAAAAIALYAWLRFFHDPAALAVFAEQAALTRTSLRLLLGLGLEAARLHPSTAAGAARLATTAAFLLLYARWVLLAWRGTAPLPLLALKSLLAAAFLGLGMTNPWYLAWALPFAFMPGGEGWRSWALALNWAAPLSYLYHVALRTLSLGHQLFQLAFLLLPLLPRLRPPAHRSSSP